MRHGDGHFDARVGRATPGGLGASAAAAAALPFGELMRLSGYRQSVAKPTFLKANGISWHFRPFSGESSDRTRHQHTSSKHQAANQGDTLPLCNQSHLAAIRLSRWCQDFLKTKKQNQKTKRLPPLSGHSAWCTVPTPTKPPTTPRSLMKSKKMNQVALLISSFRSFQD